MLKVGITLYLVLATLAGPCVCCCTAARILSALIPSPPEPETLRIADRPVRKSCCHHGVATANRAKPAPSDEGAVANNSPTKVKPAGDHGCPCRQGAPGRAALRSVAPSDQLSGLTRFLAAEPDGAAWAHVSVSEEFVQSIGLREGPARGPFLTAQDILRAHHVLRC